MDVAHVQVHVGIFIYWAAQFSPFSFLPILGKKKNWCAQGENTRAPPFIFLPPHLTIHALKKFSSLFSLQSFSSTLFDYLTNTPLSKRNELNRVKKPWLDVLK